jgi:hypothetical protein
VFICRLVLATPPQNFKSYVYTRYLCDDQVQFYNFHIARARKESLGLEITSTSQNSDTPKGYKCKYFHSAMPNFNIFLLDKLMQIITYVLLFDTVSISFITGKKSSEKRCRKLRSIAELRL